MSSPIHFILHIDSYLEKVTTDYGLWTYGILFAIVFCETGLVVTPILPGDSLLFAAGAVSARGTLSPHIMALVLIVAAIVGDAVNYALGYFFGPKILRSQNPVIRFIRRFLPLEDYLARTERFYEKYGGKAVVLARFVPIVRTFAPFLAGVGKMSYPRFLAYNIIGGISWVMLFVYAGYFFGELEIVKKNFTALIMGIIFVSLLPAIYETYQARKEKLGKGKSEGENATQGKARLQSL